MPPSPLAERVKAKFPNIVKAAGLGDQVVIKKEGVRALAASLKADPEFGFNMLMDLFAVDYLHWEEKEFRFEVVYNLYSLNKNHRLFVKAEIPESDTAIDSVAAIWPAANWFEREAWDLFGIVFKGHPNLKRILMYEEFQGHPLRKDYPYNKRQPLTPPPVLATSPHHLFGPPLADGSLRDPCKQVVGSLPGLEAPRGAGGASKTSGGVIGPMN